MDSPRAMKKVVRRSSFGEPPTDISDWREKSYEARLAALEEIRQEYHRWRYDPQPRFQRFYKIVGR